MRPIGHPAFDNFKDFRFGNIFFKQARNACAFAVTTCVKVVAADGFADQTDFRQHGAAATIRATGYAQNNVFVFQAVFGEHFVDFIGECRQEAFGLRHCQRASRQGNASHGVFTLDGNRFADKAMIFGDFINRVFQFGRYIGNHQILVGRQTEVAGMDFGNFADACFQRPVGIIEQAAVFNKQSQMPVAFMPLYPADMVAAMGKLVRANGLKLNAHAPFDFFFEHIHADALQRIACTRCFAVATVTPVALGADDGFCGVEGVFKRNETEFIGNIGISFGITVFAG